MANCSQTYGNYEFLLPKNNDNAVKALALFITLMQKRLGNCEYDTYIPDYDNDYDNNLEYIKQEIIPASDEGPNDKLALITPFFGTGRWSYKTNIESMSNWMGLRSNDVVVKTDNETLISLLGNASIKIVCQYTDFDPGMEMLCKGEVTWLLDKTLMLPIIEIIENPLDCTYKNLVDTEMIGENDDYIDATDSELVKESILHGGCYEIEKIAEDMGVRKENVISKLTDVLNIKSIKEIGWLELNDTAINVVNIPEIIYDLAEKYLSYKHTRD